MVKCKLLKVEVLVEVVDMFIMVGFEFFFVKLVVKLVDFEDMNELVCLLYEEVKVI